MTTPSPNFQFLEKRHPLLVRYAALAERYVFDDPNTALFKLRQFAETMAKEASSYMGVYGSGEGYLDVLRALRDRGLLTAEVSRLFHSIRMHGNQATHSHFDSQREAFRQLKLAWQLAKWFHRTFANDPNFKPGAFVPPPNPEEAQKVVLDELDRLRAALVQKEQMVAAVQRSVEQEAALRREADARAERAYEDLEAALELAQESETQLQQQLDDQVRMVAEDQARYGTDATQVQQEYVARAAEATQAIDLAEADTRKLIDEQLREAGWTVDSQSLTWEHGTRPQKGKALAISEWPVKGGRADYMLFVGLQPIAVVEAKRRALDVPGVSGHQFAENPVVRCHHRTLLDFGAL